MRSCWLGQSRAGAGLVATAASWPQQPVKKNDVSPNFRASGHGSLRRQIHAYNLYIVLLSALWQLWPWRLRMKTKKCPMKCKHCTHMSITFPMPTTQIRANYRSFEILLEMSMPSFGNFSTSSFVRRNFPHCKVGFSLLFQHGGRAPHTWVAGHHAAVKSMLWAWETEEGACYNWFKRFQNEIFNSHSCCVLNGKQIADSKNIFADMQMRKLG